MLRSMDLRPLGDRALIVRGITSSRWKNAQRLADALRACRPPGVEEILPAFDTVAVLYDPLTSPDNPLEALGHWVASVFEGAVPTAIVTEPRIVEIPVRYGGKDGPDLAGVSERLNLAREAVVRLHTQKTYRVLAVGFMPGFGYLGRLAQRLRLPRRDSVRSRVPPGSVAIAGQYTGVYPFASPGGWHLIGQTSSPMFDLSSGASLRVGDHVRFVATEVNE